MRKLFGKWLPAALCAALVVSVAACGTSEREAQEKRRAYNNTSARPKPAPEVRKISKPKWAEPSEAIERNPLKLRRGGMAHLAVTAGTFDGASLVTKFREELVEALQKTDTFAQVNVSGNHGHYAVDVVIFDVREEDGILFLSGGQRLKVGTTVIDTLTKRRLSPEDPKNLFYGSLKEVIEQIATYLAS